MIGRGENIGTAYIKIIADGKGMSKDIADMFDDADWDAHGRKASNQWTEGFEKEQQSAPNQRVLRDAIAGPLTRGDWLSRTFFRSRNWSNFRSGMERQWGDLGTRVSDRFEKDLLRGMKMDRLNERLADITNELVRAQKEKDSEILESERETQARIAKFHRDSAEQERRLLRRYAAEHKATLREMTENMALFQRESGQLFAGDRDTMGKARLQDLSRTIREQMRQTGETNKVWNDILGDTDRRLRVLNPRLHEMSSGFNRLGDTTGRMFGRGSRNDFIHVIGGMAGAMVRMVGIIPRTISGLINLGRGAAEAGGFMAGLGFLASRLGVGLGIAGAAVGGFVLLIGPLISALSLAAGAVIGLASALAGALVGGLGAAAGAAVPFALGIGVAVAAFDELDGAAKRAANGIKDAFKGLKGSAGEGLQFDERGLVRSFGIIERMVQSLNPLIREVGQGVNIAIGSFARAVRGPLAQFIDATTIGGEKMGWMGQQVAKLGDAMGNAFGGMLGLFRGMMPLINRFTTWLQDSMRDFNEWANSARGQNEIKDFFETAGDAAENFGDFIRGSLKLLGALINLGSGEGGQMFEDMGRKMEELATWLNTPQGAAAFQGWMEDSREFAEALGNLVVEVGKFIAIIDNDLTRAIAGLGIGAMTAPFRAVGFAVEYVGEAMKFAEDSIRGFAGMIGNLLNKLPAMAGMKGIAQDLIDFSNGGKEAARAMDTWGTSMQRNSGHVRILLENIKGLPKRVETRIEQKGLPESIKGLDRLIKQMNLTPKQVRTLLKLLGAEEAMKEYRAIQRESKETDKQKAIPKADLDPKKFNKELAVLLGDLKSLDKEKVTPTADLERGPFNAGANATKAMLRDIGNDVATPWIRVQTNAQAVASGVNAILNSIQDEYVNIFTTKRAAGTITSGPEMALIGEAGREAVVPLDRPLGQVDPSVRWLAAIAQGKIPAMAAGGIKGGGKTINATFNVTTPTTDPAAVASETVNRLATTGY